MYVPVLKKIHTSINTLVERALPVSGAIYVKPGVELRPFDKVGDCLFSHQMMPLPDKFKPKKKIVPGGRENFRRDSVVGHLARERIIAPFDGDLVFDGEVYVFKEIEKKHSLLSGVWGTVSEVIPSMSVLIKTQVADIAFALATPVVASGEMVIFPNPTEILEEYYLESFLKNPLGKVVYIGNYVKEDVVEKAHKLGIGAAICGSTTKKAFDYALKNKFGLGVISGYGKMQVPSSVYNYLSKISYRQVFFEGDRSILSVPIPLEEFMQNNDKGCVLIKEVLPADKVQVFQKNYFGNIGTVDRVGENSIFVRFKTEDKSVIEILSPNFFILQD